PAEPPHDARPRHPRHHSQDRRPTGTRRRVRAAALAGSPGQGSAPAPAWPEALLAACSVEPTIGHLKNKRRMGRNHLAGRAGDAANAVLAAVGYNFGLLLRWLALLLRIVLAVLAAPSHSNRTSVAS